MVKASRIALAAVLALGAAGLSAAQDTQPNVRLAREWVAAASAFENYTRQAGAISPGFAGPRDIEGALRVGASHDAKQVEAGMVAYAALAAVQEPGFVAAVRRISADPTAREQLVRRLTENPDAALELPGADAAAAHARDALLRQIEPLIADGRRVKQAAYDVQHHSWSKVMVKDAPARLALVKQLSARPFSPRDEDANRLFLAVTARIEPGSTLSPSRVVTNGLAVAALALAGRAGDEDAEAVRPLMSDPGGASCLRMAKLNLFQCMAVAGPHYEDVFCLGEHAMIEPGQCMAKAAGADGSARSVKVAEAGGTLIPVAASRGRAGER
ncbi:MAG: hypothetical protein ACJ798_06165 [Phenylobacterium sp.]